MSVSVDAFDHIVLGCGAFGSAACYWLTKSGGSNILGLEQYEIAHDKGSSGDISRFIRPYHRDAAYRIILPYAYESWDIVGRELHGESLVVRTGGVEYGDASPAGRQAISDLVDSLDDAGIKYDALDARDMTSRWPQFREVQGDFGIYQADGGFVNPKKAIRSHIDGARARGATILSGVGHVHLRRSGNAVTLRVGPTEFTTRSLIITAGAWTAPVLRQLGVDIDVRVTEEQVTYFGDDGTQDFQLGSFPAFTFRSEDKMIYGGPKYQGSGVKITQEMQRRVVTPDSRSFKLDVETLATCRAFAVQRLRGVDGEHLTAGQTCLYAAPTDRKRELTFVDVSDEPAIRAVLGGGVGFKYSSLVGRVLSDLATDKRPLVDIDPFLLPLQ